MWLRLYWKDERLAWNQTAEQIDHLQPTHEDVWTPDFVFYNQKKAEPLVMSKIFLYPSGDLTWSVPYQISFFCTFDLRKFPSDEQDCSMELAAWSYHGGLQDINIFTRGGKPFGVDLSVFQPTA